MSLGIELRIAWLSALAHRRRTLLLCGALAVVTALLVLLNGVSAGMERTLIENATTLSSGHLNVGGFFKVTPGRAAPLVTAFEGVNAVVQRSLPELAFSVERGRGWGKVVSDQGAQQVSMNGIDLEREPHFQEVLRLESGNVSELVQAGTILLFESQAKKLKVRVGDAVTLSAQTTHSMANTVDCRVVAIARDVGFMSQWNVFVPNEVVRRLYDLRADVTGAIEVFVKPEHEAELERLASVLRLELERAGYRVLAHDSRPFWMKLESVAREDWAGQKLDVTTWQDELSFMMWTLKLLDSLTALLSAILMAVVLSGIINTLWIAIRERSREIGTLRAIGMQRGSILRTFVLEAFCLGAVGALTGTALALVSALIVNAVQIHVPAAAQLLLMKDTLRIALTSTNVLGALALVSCATAAAAVYPALRAARLTPVVAMSHLS